MKCQLHPPGHWHQCRPRNSMPAHSECSRPTRRAACCSSTAAEAQSGKSAEYNKTMRDAMGWEGRPFEYDYSRGLYFHQIKEGLFCGSQPRHARDIEELKLDLALSTIISLQQDKDMVHWGVNADEIRRSCVQMGISLVRRPVMDFDPDSLRKVLPSAVKSLHNALHPPGQPGGRVYVHCTAGLGRAPAVIIAYLFWFHEPHLTLHQAYDLVTQIRPCGPKKDSIRAATFDLLSNKPPHQFAQMPPNAYDNMSQEERHRIKARVLSWQ